MMIAVTTINYRYFSILKYFILILAQNKYINSKIGYYDSDTHNSG